MKTNNKLRQDRGSKRLNKIRLNILKEMYYEFNNIKNFFLQIIKIRFNDCINNVETIYGVTGKKIRKF